MKTASISIYPGTVLIIIIDGKVYKTRESLSIDLIWTKNLVPYIKENKISVELSDDGSFNYEVGIPEEIVNKIKEFSF